MTGEMPIMPPANPVADLSATRERHATPFHSTIPLAAWLLVQIGANSLVALRIPLWPHAPAAGEFLAMDVLLIVQILFAALLSSRLCQDWRTTVMAIAAAGPFAIFAGSLAAASSSTILHAAMYVGGWIVVLRIWNLPFPSKRGRMTVSAVAATWAAAGPLLLFIGNEFGAAPFHSTGTQMRLVFGPIIGALSDIGENRMESGFVNSGWVMLAGTAILGMIVFLLKKIAVSRRPDIRPGGFAVVSEHPSKIDT